MPYSSPYRNASSGLTGPASGAQGTDARPAQALRMVHGAFTTGLAATCQGLAGTASVSLVALEDTLGAVAEERWTEMAYLVPFGAGAPHAGAVVFGGGLAPLLVERVLGYGDADATEERILSELEVQVLGDAARGLLDAYAEAWRPYVRVELLREDAPFPLRADEPVFLATYRVAIGRTVAPLFVMLRLAAWQDVLAAVSTREPAPATRNGLVQAVGDCQLTARVLLGSTQVTVRDLLSLRPGDVICLDRRADDPLEVRIGRRPKLLGRVGTAGHRYTLTVEGVIARRDQDAT